MSDPGTLKRLRLGILQLAIRDGDPEANTERALQLLDEAPAADLYLLPELWTTGYAHDSWDGAADRHTPRILERLGQEAEDRRAWIGGSMITRRENGALVNRLWLVHPDGSAPSRYDKAHLFEPMGEVGRLEPGEERVRAGIGEWNAGLSLCYDLRFPGMYRLDALDGADLFLVPSEWPAERHGVLELLARARAAENQAYLVLCNRAGADSGGAVFGGGSMVVDPAGDMVMRAGSGMESGVCRADHGRVRAVREAIPVLDRERQGIDFS